MAKTIDEIINHCDDMVAYYTDRLEYVDQGSDREYAAAIASAEIYKTMARWLRELPQQPCGGTDDQSDS